MKTALISVTFRKKTIEEVAALAKQAGLEAIEWGGDVHVPPMDTDAISRALAACKENGLEISAYGSYYRCEEGVDFAPVLETAVRLGTPIIRVWAGTKGTDKATEEDWAVVIKLLREAVALAAEKGCIVATEYHPDTLTDNIDSAERLFAEVPGLYTYWQPNHTRTVEQCLDDIRRLGNRVQNIHVFQRDEKNLRVPLEWGKDRWAAYLPAVAAQTQSRFAGLEFMPRDSEEQLMIDAALLHDLMKGI